MYRDNPLTAKLRAGRPGLGCWLTLGDSATAEILGLAGYDCVLMDHEHGAIDLRETLTCLQALSALPAAGLIRVPWNDPVYIKRVLDLGVEGVMVPSVNSAEEARAAVAACRYPPGGVRGAAYPIVRAADYGLARDRYRQTGEGNLLILCQIESAQAVEAVPDIAAVDGVDVLFVGPYDLSGSIGRLGRFDDPEVAALVRRAERAVKDSGRWLGALPSLGRTPADMVRDGADLVIAGSDVRLLRDAARAEVAAFRTAAGDANGEP